MKHKKTIYFILLLSLCFTAERVLENNSDHFSRVQIHDSGEGNLFVGDYDKPPNPMTDRAKGYAVQGRAKSAILNFGNVVDGFDHFPAGAWGPYSYLPNVTFMAGVPGYVNVADFEWTLCSECLIDLNLPNGATAWTSEEAYSSWNEKTNEDGPARYSGIAYNIADDRGDLSLPRASLEDLGTERYACSIGDYIDEETCEANSIIVDGEFVYGDWNYNVYIEYEDGGAYIKYAEDAIYEYFVDENSQLVYLVMLEDNIDPNNANSMIGLVYPWAFRAKFTGRNNDDYDDYDYGDDEEAWSADDYYDFYGAQTAEGWLTRVDNAPNTDWHATVGSAEKFHNTEFSVGDLFGDTDFASSSDDYPVLAHSNLTNTWPIAFNDETLNNESFWPGWYADEYFGDDPDAWESNGINAQLCGANPSRTNPECWKELEGRFTSDSDVYMQFDDRWSHKGNMVENGEYAQTGYPMGLTVRAMAHSYGVSYAEDIMFVTVKVRNESGDYDYAFMRNSQGEKEDLTDYEGKYIDGEGLIMPDGTKLNGGKGFNYERVALGFYMDADALWGSLDEYNSGLHTNADDFMEYYDCKNDDIVNSPEWENYSDGCPVIDGDTLRISMAMIYDYDGQSGSAQGFGNETTYSGDMGIVATQLLDSPYATVPVDLNQDGFDDIYPGEKLKMTDWHWFDWYNRPGVVANESGGGCYAGGLNCPQAPNKEEIMYKLLSGEASNLNAFEKVAYFHTDNPDTDLDSELNPHFDSLKGLKETTFFTEGEEGLDCVLLLSCSPFDLEVGEEVNFSFCIIFGQDRADLLKNAEFAQIMYNAHYQGYTSPKKPRIALTSSDGQVKIHWSDNPEPSKDVITNYTDFAGYKIYRSDDGGQTWGPNSNMIYDGNNNFYGWQHYKQFDMSAIQDSSFCVTGFESKCYINNIIDENISTESSCEDDGGLWLSFEDDNLDGIWNEGESYFCHNNVNREVQVSGVDPFASWVNLGTNNGLELVIPDSQCAVTDIDQDECKCGSGGDWNNNTGKCESGAETGYQWDKWSSEKCLAPLNEETCTGSGFEWKRVYYNDGEEDYKYTYIDNEVTNGYEYTYSVTSFDTGVMADIITPIEIDTDGDGIDDTWITDTLSVPDPNGWANVNPFQSLECSKGTSEYDDNFAKIVPGLNPQTNWSLVEVIPNPYISSADWEQNPLVKQIMFTGLTQKCTIKIFTITGELVRELYHEELNNEGFKYWDVRNQNNQEIAPGLYLFTIEDLSGGTDEVHIGKFVVIR